MATTVYVPTKVTAVENLKVGEVATFRQYGKLAELRKFNHEKVTSVKKVNQNAVKVTTVTKGGSADTYTIPVGTEMRVHRFYDEVEEA